VHGGQDPVEADVAEQGAGPGRVPVSLAQLDAGQDALGCFVALTMG
jgi:hypothetical protein